MKTIPNCFNTTELQRVGDRSEWLSPCRFLVFFFSRFILLNHALLALGDYACTLALWLKFLCIISKWFMFMLCIKYYTVETNAALSAGVIINTKTCSPPSLEDGSDICCAQEILKAVVVNIGQASRRRRKIVGHGQ